MSVYEAFDSTIKVAGVTVPYHLDTNGFEAGSHGPRNNNFREERISAARAVIKNGLKKARNQPIKTRNDWVQSKVEESLGYFLTPGELIVAMIGEGFKFKVVGQQCLFNVDINSMSNIGRKRPYYTHINQSKL